MKYKIYESYYQEQPWLPFSEMILDWEDKFHELMLNDSIRMIAYERAIKETIKPGDIVLDLGAGTGILSQWALEAGAARVYAIEMDSAILDRAIQRINQTGLSSQFIPLNQISYDIKLSEKVDVLISEIIGNMADNEDFQPILQDALKRFLKPGGIALPKSVNSYLVPVASQAAHNCLISGDIASISERYTLSQLLIDKNCSNPFDLYYDTIIPRSCYLASPQSLMHYSGEWKQSASYQVKRNFVVARDGDFTGFKAYFIAQLTDSVTLDISGDDIEKRLTSDSWKHAYLPIEESISVCEGDIIDLTFTRFYPTDSVSQFRQVYHWQGEVRREGYVVARFTQGVKDDAEGISTLREKITNSDVNFPS